jgi:hypothetical protein
VATAARDRLAQFLGESGQEAVSSTELQAPPGDIRVTVEGAGRLACPISAAQAKKLITLGTPARFGRGEHTLTDPAVRDTWEIPRRLVTAEWDEKALATVLEGVREGLGLPWNCVLEADFHSMLVYDKGQFFVTHQDSEKEDAMIGTLVVTLPSAFTGGELLIGQGEEWKAYRGSKTAHTLVAFYADRQHEVLPVKTGYRVTLTYNLLMHGDTSGHTDSHDTTVAQLAHCLTEHFAVPAERSWGGALDHPPGRLVYLLDHEYTPSGLSWRRLKGADASRCDLLRSAAGQAGCEIVLALAEVRETHEAYPEGDYYDRGRFWDEGDNDIEDDNEEDYDGEFVVQDLINSEVDLTHWLAPDDKGCEEVSLSIDSHEVCASTPSGSLQPYSSQYEGNMGNYGNTLDRWYKRGALVVWPRDQAFANRAQTSPRWAMEELSRRAQGGDLTGARAAAKTVDVFWARAAQPPATPGLFPAALQAAADLQDVTIADALIRPFRIEALRPADAPALAQLAAGYGEPWMSGLLSAWYGGDQSWSYPEGRREWLIMLPALAGALHAAGPDGATAARQITKLAWTWLRTRATSWLSHKKPSQREQSLSDLGAPLAALLAATPLAGAADLVEHIGDWLRKQPHEVIPLLLATLKAAADLPGDAQEAGGFADIAAGCAARLRVLQGRQPRAAADWSIVLGPGECSCELCGTLRIFLADPAQRTFGWRLRTDDRAHVHRRIDDAEIPVTHVTRRTGRPYTLVLTKTDRLFTAEQESRATDAATLQWLAATWL